MNSIDQFLMGAIAMIFATVALFFVRYWRDSRDRFFGWFALAFFILAINRVLLTFFQQERETNLILYLVRLLAFLIILLAIADKNLRRTDPRS